MLSPAASLARSSAANRRSHTDIHAHDKVHRHRRRRRRCTGLRHTHTHRGSFLRRRRRRRRRFGARTLTTMRDLILRWRTAFVSASLQPARHRAAPERVSRLRSFLVRSPCCIHRSRAGPALFLLSAGRGPTEEPPASSAHFPLHRPTLLLFPWCVCVCVPSRSLPHEGSYLAGVWLRSR